MASENNLREEIECPVKILHTSDWHLGRTLYGRKRCDEFEAFLAWLAETIREREIDALLVAGDVFDTSAPSNRAQELYYRFLCRVVASNCRHVVVIAGNHDSPSFLNAPKELLKALNVHVVGNASDCLEDEVLVLRNAQDAPELIVCAVPYLRDRDIRTAEAGESVEDKERKLIDGIRAHYAAVAALAEQKRAESGGDIPVVGMGHLFTAGGQTVDGDGVRELYVGSLAHVAAQSFPASFDYLALGHLHIPQMVSGTETMRYSGSPLPMGFGEAKQQKSVCRVEFAGRAASVQLIDVPVFQKLECVKGDWDDIARRILELSATDASSWLEVVYEGEEIIGDLRERLETAIDGTQMEILRVTNNRVINRVLGQLHAEETLDDLTVNDVFERCLAAHDVPDEQRPELMRTYREAVASIYEDDALF
jgi:exonuclease SbcD